MPYIEFGFYCGIFPFPSCRKYLLLERHLGGKTRVLVFSTHEQFLVNLVNLFGSLKLLDILQKQASELDLKLSIILAKLGQNGAENFVNILSEN